MRSMICAKDAIWSYILTGSATQIGEGYKAKYPTEREIVCVTPPFGLYMAHLTPTRGGGGVARTAAPQKKEAPKKKQLYRPSELCTGAERHEEAVAVTSVQYARPLCEERRTEIATTSRNPASYQRDERQRGDMVSRMNMYFLTLRGNRGDAGMVGPQERCRWGRVQ